ncbi:type VI secretion system Vgr family protein [Falsiroseomonas sp.]|uniref:type VI secretion system Vgr family protein n=1 Tax=Falsiroseomonas sp. TaxID=2870721 RepID=UPI0035640149
MAKQREARLTLETSQPLVLRRLTGREEVSQPFRYDLTLLGPSHDLDLEALLGTGATVELEGTGGPRHIHGLIADVTYGGAMEEQARYDLVLVPWLWFLDRRTDCRIFQRMNAVEIVKRVVAGHGGELRDRLTGNYIERDFCVQYRESDLNFVSRLLEEEGVFFFFEHSRGRHEMVLVDDPASCPTRTGYDTVPFYPPDDPAQRERDHLDRWDIIARARTARTALRSFDFKQPARPLEAAGQASACHARDDLEAYDYPGGFVATDAGDARAQVMLEALRADRRRILATGNASGLACGHRFKLRDFPRSDQNAEHLILAVETMLEVESQRSLPGTEGEPYRCTLEAIDTRLPFRPAHRTPRPFVHGPQTAIVTGPSGEEIYTDAHGRVKVQFHWDREGKSDADSSCWVRVSQAWAGAGFGAIHIPRIGQEVIVDFLEGDPDQPIITGRVYNAARTVPFDLPGNATQSGIKSNSSKGGGGSNELRFEDRKGSEQVYLHAQKDEAIVVENDKTETVHHNETITIDVDRTESVGHDETLSVGNNRTRSVGVDEGVTVGANQSVTVGSNQTVTVGASRVDTVVLNEARSIGVAQQMTIGAARNVTVGATQAHQVGRNDSWAVGRDRTASIGGNDSLDVAMAQSVSVGNDQIVSVGKGQSVSVGKAIVITAGDEITIKTGNAMIVMKKNGDITIKGKNVLVDGSGKIDQKAGGNITQKGRKILQNS